MVVSKQTQLLFLITAAISWIISLMAAFRAEDGWLQAGQFFFFGIFFLLLGFQVEQKYPRYKILSWASLAISMIFAVLHLMN